MAMGLTSADGKFLKEQAAKRKKKPTYEERQAESMKAMREQARKRHAQFKKDRATKGKGNKSYNKGKPKSEWVDSAYERRQKDAETSMRDAARKRHAEFKRKRAAAKKAKQDKKTNLKIHKNIIKEAEKHTGSSAGSTKKVKKTFFTTM